MIEWIIIGLLAVIGLVVSLVIISFFNTWLKAFLAKATVGFTTLRETAGATCRYDRGRKNYRS